MKSAVWMLMSICFFTLTSCASVQENNNFYNEIGGDKTLKKIFGIAVNRIYKDPDIGHFFDGIPKRHIHKLLVQQTCDLIGGPCEYQGRDMVASHKEMGVTDKDFYILVEHVQFGIRKAGLNYQQENFIIAKFAPMKQDIVYQ